MDPKERPNPKTLAAITEAAKVARQAKLLKKFRGRDIFKWTRWLFFLSGILPFAAYAIFGRAGLCEK